VVTVERSKQSNHSRLVLAAWVILVDVCLAHAQTVRVPGTGVSMIPPSGFSVAKDFPGFENVELQSSIVVTEVAVPSVAIQSGMTTEGLASKGMALLGSKRITIGGKEALLLAVTQKVGDTEWRKWMLVGGDDKRTVMIGATFPPVAVKTLNQPVVRSLLTASWGTESAPDVFEGLLYRVSPSPRLKIAGRMTNVLMLNESGSMPPSDPDQAFYVVGNSLGKVDVADLKALSEQRARHADTIRDLRNLVWSATQLDGLQAYEIVADATDVKTGTHTKFYQVLASDGAGYFLVQGFVIAERASEMLQEFRRVTATFRRVQ
jgi:hypothetical protein